MTRSKELFVDKSMHFELKNLNVIDMYESNTSENYLLVWIRKGKARLDVDDKNFLLQKGSLFLLYPDQFWKLIGDQNDSIEGVLLEFASDLVAENKFFKLEEQYKLILIKEFPVVHVEEKWQVRLTDIFEWLTEEYESSSYDIELIKYKLILVLHIYKRAFENREALPELNSVAMRFSKLVGDHFMNNHSVKFYADALSISSKQLNLILKESYGRTTQEMIHNRLVYEAKRNLIYSDVSIKEIAFSLGFQDASYFNRFFKKLVKCTPLEYRIESSGFKSTIVGA
ncbi:AraC family transcriptional regulator [Aureibacter tunicatorum]|uniref:AraC-like DNA-binding protein n=1 Tax=Aureibacter tunicatorum TaxID=866807 RepID=A0AAE3XKD4_9BACT|nr:AraC family transcriptional regulator [Aureibacter tunicatorum]MDR6238027.1 AraC-like DNA-binding protein [Aureibacter tunicatorum]BDD03060.1 hypothetical protein AUTU_05430 [Aureibacter tunicatorum]